METFYSFLETPIGQLVTGALIAILISLVFSWWGTKQLRNETEKLRKLNILTIRILDEGNLLPPGTKPTKDEAGNYTGGFTHELSAALEGKATLEAAAVVREDDTDTPEQEDPSEEKGPRQE
jgi:hypothetical protein